MIHVIAVLLAAAVAFTSAATPPVHPPKMLRHKHLPDLLGWVDASEAFDSNGRLRPELATWELSIMKNLRANADGACTTFMIQSPLEIFHDRSTTAAIGRNAAAALSGRVVSTSVGFYGGFPGTLVGFRVTGAVARQAPTRGSRSHKGHYTGVTIGSILYTFVGKAAISRPTGAICSDVGGVPIPDKGDEILVFTYLAPVDAADLIVPTDPRHDLVIERGQTRIYTPEGLKSDIRGLTIADALERIRHSAAKSERQP